MVLFTYNKSKIRQILEFIITVGWDIVFILICFSLLKVLLTPPPSENTTTSDPLLFSNIEEEKEE
ncbi:hypothetical protein EBS02_13060 [bacterium]|nr:hypothetical protein [bacterium]